MFLQQASIYTDHRPVVTFDQGCGSLRSQEHWKEGFRMEK